MKKLLVLLLMSFIFVVQTFAADFIISPTIGYNNVSVAGTITSNLGNKSSHDAFLVGLTLGTVTEKGFTFYWDNTFALNPSIRYKLIDPTSNIKASSIGCMWRTEFLFGGTLKFYNDTLQVGIAVGAGAGVGGGILTKVNKDGVTNRVNRNDIAKYGGWFAGPSIHVNVDYFFLDWLGITLSMTNSFNAGASSASYNKKEGGISNLVFSEDVGYFSNNFSLLIGPKFKF